MCGLLWIEHGSVGWSIWRYTVPCDPPALSVACSGPPVEVKFAEPKCKPPRPYFARLDPHKDMRKQAASRIARYIAAHGDENGQTVYMVMF
jgi:hypothetical protein